LAQRISIHTYIELYARLLVDLVPNVVLFCADRADAEGNLYTGLNTEDTPVIVEAAAYHDGIVIVQVNQIVGLWTVPLLDYCVTLRGDFEHEHDDQFGALAEWLALELVPLGIDHLSYLKFLLQDTKQTISIIQG
jgi:Malonate decarboxylase, alpha subunit, transporter